MAPTEHGLGRWRCPRALWLGEFGAAGAGTRWTFIPSIVLAHVRSSAARARSSLMGQHGERRLRDDPRLYAHCGRASGASALKTSRRHASLRVACAGPLLQKSGRSRPRSRSEAGQDAQRRTDNYNRVAARLLHGSPAAKRHFALEAPSWSVPTNQPARTTAARMQRENGAAFRGDQYSCRFLSYLGVLLGPARRSCRSRLICGRERSVL